MLLFESTVASPMTSRLIQLVVKPHQNVVYHARTQTTITNASLGDGVGIEGTTSSLKLAQVQVPLEKPVIGADVEDRGQHEGSQEFEELDLLTVCELVEGKVCVAYRSTHFHT